MKVAPDVEAPDPPPSSPSKMQSLREKAMDSAKKRREEIKAMKVNLFITLYLRDVDFKFLD